MACKLVCYQVSALPYRLNCIYRNHTACQRYAKGFCIQLLKQRKRFYFLQNSVTLLQHVVGIGTLLSFWVPVSCAITIPSVHGSTLQCTDGFWFLCWSRHSQPILLRILLSRHFTMTSNGCISLPWPNCFVDFSYLAHFPLYINSTL